MNPASQDDWRATSRSMLGMLVAMMGFVSNDAFMKLILAHLPLGQTMFLRSLFALVFLAFVAKLATPIPLAPAFKSRPALLRSSLEVFGTLLLMSALTRMPLANASAILQAIPLTVTAGAALFMGMAVGWRRWSAIGVGFVGVILVIDPNIEDFNAWSLLCVAAVFMAAGRDLSTRFVTSQITTLSLMTMSLVFLGATGLALGLMEDWRWPTAFDLWCLVAAASLVMVGHIGVVISMRSGNVAAAAPMRYTAVVWALLIGLVVWGDVPDLQMLVGTAIIVASGIYAYWREQKRKSAASPAGTQAEARGELKAGAHAELKAEHAADN